MVTEYQTKIMKMGEIQFEDIEDTDILTFELWEQGFGPRCFFYLYNKRGELKDIKCGKEVPMAERVFVRPRTVSLFSKKLKEPKRKKEKKIVEKTVVDFFEERPIIKRRNVSSEERTRRSERMKEVARKYWEKKRQENASP